MPRSLCLAAAFLVGAISLAVARPSPGKGPIHGLVTMGSLRYVLNPTLEPEDRLAEANAHPGLYAGAVLAATWDQLEPQPNRFDFSTLDQALARVRAYNAAHPQTPLVAKLRIFAGLHSPDWVKQLDGGPVSLSRGAKSATFPHFWSVPYRSAWRNLQRVLAARYDTNPLVAEVAVSSCASVTAEPFVVALSPGNRPAMLKAGYTEAAMQACLLGAIDDYAVWRHTAIDFTFSPFRRIIDGHIGTSAAFTSTVMEKFRAQYGARGVIANHGLQPRPLPQAVPIYEAIKRLGPPIEFQTLKPREDWDAAFAAARAIGMTELEIWNTQASGGIADVTTAQLQSWRQQLEP